MTVNMQNKKNIFGLSPIHAYSSYIIAIYISRHPPRNNRYEPKDLAQSKYITTKNTV